MRQSFTARTALTAAVLMIGILSPGAYIYHKTNVLNTYQSSDDVLESHAQHKHLYDECRSAAGPSITSLHMEIYLATAKGGDLLNLC